MRIRLVVAMMAVALLSAVVSPVAQGQQGEPDTVVTAASLNVATDVVNGTVVAVQSIDTGIQVHTLALVNIESTIQGNLSGQVFVEVPGGVSASGLDVVVSNQPSFRVGDVVQLALLRAPAAEEAMLTGGEPVYSVVGGLDGAVALSGSLLNQAQATGDFLLLGTKWQSMPVSYRINPTNSGVGSAATQAAINSAAQTWILDPGSDIEFSYGGVTSVSPSNYDDQYNTVGWVATPNAADTQLALAVWVSDSGQTHSFDIEYNLDYQWAVGAVAGKYDIETVALHELGHALGFNHVLVFSEIMYPAIGSNTTKGLGNGDRSGAASLYPAANPPCAEADRSGSITARRSAEPASYVAIDPVRLLDTRGASQVGEFGSPWCAGETRAVQVAGLGGVPSDVVAVAMHITSVGPTSDGSFVSVFPFGTEPPTPISMKNFGLGPSVVQITNDLVISEVAEGGRVDIYNKAGRVDLVVDVVGFFAVGVGDGFVATPPERLLDSRVGIGGYTSPWTAGETRRIGFLGQASVPPTDVTAVAVHMTSVSPTAQGSYIRATPSGSIAEATAVKNFGIAGDHAAIDNDLLILTLGDGGAVDLYNHLGQVHLVIDVVGYFTSTGGSRYVAVPASRVIDSRVGLGGLSSPWGHSESRAVTLAGIADVPLGVSAVAAHVTSVSSTADSFLMVGSSNGGAKTSAKNYGIGSGHTSITNNLMIIRVDAEGKADFYNNAGSVDFVVDVVGYLE